MKLLIQKEFLWTDLGDGYSFSELGSNYGGVNQRWLIVRSEQALKRESRTLEKRVKKEMEKASKKCWHLRNESFSCKKDAEAAVEKLEKTFRYTSLSWDIEEIRKYTKKGRPKEGDEKTMPSRQPLLPMATPLRTLHDSFPSQGLSPSKANLTMAARLYCTNIAFAILI